MYQKKILEDANNAISTSIDNDKEVIHHLSSLLYDVRLKEAIACEIRMISTGIDHNKKIIENLSSLLDKHFKQDNSNKDESSIINNDETSNHETSNHETSNHETSDKNNDEASDSTADKYDYMDWEPI